MATAGRTVVFSALTVAASLLSLVVFPQQFLKSMGIGGAVVAVIAAAAALLVLPALFAVMGTKLDAARRGRRPGDEPLGTPHAAVLRRPGLVAAVTALTMVVVALPTLRVQWTGVDASVLPTSHSARVVADRLAVEYPRLSADPVVIAVRAPAGARAAVARYGAQVGDVAGVRSVTTERVGPGTWRIDAIVPGSPIAPAAQSTVAAISAVPHRFPVEVGGAAARVRR